jgi:hypothetical protein
MNGKENWVNLALAPFGGLVGALIGGVLWAKYIQWTGLTAGWVALVIGILTGLGVLLTGRTRRMDVSLVAALFAVVGILFGKYLDVRWNAPKEMTVAIIQQHGDIPPEYAESIAKSVEASEAGGSTWRLMRRRMEWFDLVYYAAAAFIAFRVAYSRRLHRRLFKTE